MDCKEVQKNISCYLDGKLNTKQMMRFLDHVENCSDCMEELSIQYLVEEGTARLEEGRGFDLNRELKKKIEDSREEIKRRRKLNMVLYAFEALAIIAVIFILVLVVLNR